MRTSRSSPRECSPRWPPPRPLLDAIRYVEGNRQRQLLLDAPLGVLSPTYRAWVVDEHGRTVRTRYEIAIWLTARDALRARRLYRAGSHRYGDPRVDDARRAVAGRARRARRRL